MAKLFGTNGVRGVFDKDFTLEFVHDLTLAVAKYFKSGPILVGCDGRDSSYAVLNVVCSALNYSGLDCNNAGLVPTPCLEYCVKKLGYSGGIMITASHNPPHYNGIKPIASDGVEISREDELIIEDIYFKKDWQKATTWGITGSELNAIETYVDGVISKIDSDKIKKKRFTVVLDTGNGAQAVTAPKFSEKLNCKTIVINEKIDGSFPGRGSEPTPQNLSELSSAVIENNADIGIAFDGDGDRSILCDDKGEILTGDRSALLLVKHILSDHPQSTIVTCLNSGSAIEELAGEFDSKVIRTKVGSVEVSRKMVPTDAIVGFEENGGFMFGLHNQVRDGCMALGLALELLAKSEKSISENVSMLPLSFTTKDKVECSAGDAAKLIDKLKQENPKADTTDGIKITFGPKEWVMIRPSGTEPIIRIYGEAQSQQKLVAIMEQFIQKAKSIVSS